MMNPSLFRVPFAVASATLVLIASFDDVSAANEGDLATTLRQLNPAVVPADDPQAKQLPGMLSDDIRSRRRAANERETKAWREIKTKAEWERYRDARIKALRDSLGADLTPPKEVKVTSSPGPEGDGYRIDKLVFESRPGLMVTANLYSPSKPGKSMPGIVICPSHHNPKTQSELQDMGMIWAREGCVVIVPDNLGHGERRQHPFARKEDYAGEFKVGRQDYYFRYNVGMQLHLAGESLMGWIVTDLQCCVSVLLAEPGVDRHRILLLGSVAGGGDPAAVAAALDPRITAVGAFNFGGPQPETIFPLPEDADASFNYAGGGSWESTRNLRLSARDGFLPWVIVGATAPRRLVYSHEFAWDQEHDPVWTRLQKIYGFYEVPDRLSETHGKGKVTGPAGPENTHCNNIGPVHRAGMYPALNRWFKLDLTPEKEYRKPVPSADLLCLTPEVAKTVKLRPVHELATELARDRGKAVRDRRSALKPEERVKTLREEWTRLLGDVEPAAAPKSKAAAAEKIAGGSLQRVLLEVEPQIVVPVLILTPTHPANTRLPVVVGIAQEGKQAFLKQRAEAVAELLRGGVAVVLPDLRGTGETQPSDRGRGRGSAATSLSSSELMLGQTLLGERLRDLRTVLKYLRTRDDLDSSRMALWGESFAEVNAADTDLRVPLDAEKSPAQSEPLGGLLALLGALYEPEVKAACSRGGLDGYTSVLQDPFCYLPHDVIVPGVLTTGDLADIAESLAPRPLRLEGVVDGQNRRVAPETLAKQYGTARAAYQAANAADRLALEPDGRERDRAAWLLAQLKAK